MNNLLISCEPALLDQDNEGVMQTIRSLGDCVRINKFFWYVHSAKSAADASIALRAGSDPNNIICVVDATNETIALDVNTSPEAMNAIRQNWNKGFTQGR